MKKIAKKSKKTVVKIASKAEAKKIIKKKASEKKKAIRRDYAKLRKKMKSDLSMEDFTLNTQYTIDMLKYHWGSLAALDKAARIKYPNMFSDVRIENIISPKKRKALRSTIAKNQRFFITTAVTSCDLDVTAYKTAKYYCKKNNAKMLILVSSDPAHNLDKDSLGRIDKRLTEEYIVVEDSTLNSNLFLSTIKLSAKQIDPITGLSRIGQRDGSFIFASPKQRLKGTAVSNQKMPHFLMTTGAITLPDYSSTNYMSNRTAVIADSDHVMGGVIVEVVDDTYFHFRQVQFDSKGKFIDLGIEYSSRGTKKVAPEAFVLGDWHAGDTSPIAKRCWQEVCEQLKPKSIILHDLFNGMSINHHIDNNIVTRAQIAKQGLLDLGMELQHVRDDLNELSTWVNKLVIVKSNHDEFLSRYLEEARYAKDPHNHAVSLKLADAMVNDGKDPLKFAIVELYGLKRSNKIKWLERDEDYKVARIQCGNHGDKGANGARGSIKSMEDAYGDSVSGHSHSPEILRGAWKTGTSTHLKLLYNKGPSSWMQTSCLIYPNGSRQLISVINGYWKL